MPKSSTRPTKLNNNKAKNASAPPPRVIVIGAGMSGLACARELQQRRHDVIVIEARSRVGGRVWGAPIESVVDDDNDNDDTSTQQQTFVDLGGALIHGTHNNPLSQLCVQLGIETTEHLSDCLLLDANGWPVDAKKDDRVSQLFNAALEETFREIELLKKKKEAGESSTSNANEGDDMKTSMTATEAKGESSSDEGTTAAAANSSTNKQGGSSEINEGATSATTNGDEPAATSQEEKRINGKKAAEAKTVATSVMTVAALPEKVAAVSTAASKPSLPPAATTSAASINGDVTKKASMNGAAIPEQPNEKPAATKTASNPTLSAASTAPDPTISATTSNGDTKPESATRINESAAADDNFGALFDKIAMKQHGGKSTTSKSALWKWHQANLELSCGASFDALSYTWNDDEAYGFEGAHVALKKSWKTVVEAMAEPLTIVHDCPVVAIEIVKDASVPIDGDIDEQEQQPMETEAAELERRKREASIAATASPARKSRRLNGDTGEVRRRSSRTPKKTQAFTVESHSALSYDDATLDYSSSRKVSRKNQKPKPKVRVTLQNGAILEADAVVCTIPLGVLKSDTIQFTPPLPPRKRKVISQLGCGLFNKCILSFSHVFWQDSDFLGMAGDQTPFLILNGHKITNKPILIFWFGGESAFDVDEDWHDSDLVEECMSVLRKLSQKAPPEPLDYVVTRWGQDAYARMTFSYVPPHVDGSEALSIMSEPLTVDGVVNGKPMVLFAGEHTTPFHPSTIHGAFLSGIREAYRLDLAIEPTLNGGLVFDPNNLYQKTFKLRKKKGGLKPSQPVIDGAAGRVRRVAVKEPEPSSSAATSNTNGAQKQQHRRRHTVMTLRKKKAPTTPNATAAKGDSVPPSPARQSARSSLTWDEGQQQSSNGTTGGTEQPSRKSHRKRTAKSPVPYTDGEDGMAAMEAAAAIENSYHHATTVPQDERTLQRLIHAYPNWNVIQSKVLPLYGSTKKTSALKHRYQQLRRSAKRSDKSPLEAWKVGQVKPKLSITSSSTVDGSRKSSRKAAPKKVVDL